MQAIKKVFSHDDDHHTTTDTAGTHGHTTSGLTHDNSAAVGNGATTQQQTSHHGTAGSTAEHLVEKAAPPHPHTQPTERTHLNQEQASQADHDHKHLAAVVQEKHQVHETEEVQRQRDVDRHLHHVQHHVQPVRDTQHANEQHHENVVPTTEVHERHVNTDEDKHVLAGLNRHHDKHEELGKDRVVVDKGEVVNEREHHHVHHVVQPVIQRDTHEHHTVHTTIPTHQTTHEAPIVHQSVEHEPMNIKDFVAGGGDLKSKLTHDNAGVLNEGDGCERKVDGPAESVLAKLHLKSGHHDTGAAAETRRV